ncbi:MAG: hypothetical protein WD049_04965 [Candidatus Paceibacterota bacterium]
MNENGTVEPTEEPTDRDEARSTRNPDRLRVFSRHEDPEVRKTVLRNSACPRSVRQALLDDRDPEVQAVARQTLENPPPDPLIL